MVEASLLLLEDESAFGRVLMVHVNGRLYDWHPPKGNLKQIRSPAQAAGALRALLHDGCSHVGWCMPSQSW